ncbi:methionyl-tRNA formyltransferase [Candidatus Chlamydia sanziniae]|uniref:Methionyl-tRNA formyltransferase n=1 Tax=Candidatus Chlamydia sanziniae TaxID=1806891 RepID=A0A1A9HVK4_9CHLA|nr:methionyl-tRNA formyltransferase [Candidatus Chlamydia sanziniae]ANH78451.1 Methionyl-tRNA formyltransferase [Candidatus Chlamydia sanziniae]
MSLKVVYFGTPQFAATVLEGLLAQDVHIVGVVSRADKPQKRSSQLIPSPVKMLALQHKLPLLQPNKASDPEFMQQLRLWNADVFLVVAYGAILCQTVLDIPRYGCYNLHAGLLPAYRGAAPIQRCIIDGATESGNTVIHMDAGMDTGDIVNTTYLPIGPDMTAGELALGLAEQGPDVLIKTLQQIEKNTLQPIPQDSTLATVAPKLSKEEGQIFWNQPAKKVYAHIRGVTPIPGAWTLFSFLNTSPKRLIIRKATLAAEKGSYGQSGTLLVTNKQNLLIACFEGAMYLHQVQIEGKSVMDIKIFLNGYPEEKIKIVFSLHNH